jgi:peptidoglycan hydrolase-like protein with peptidoglycan-binding domain
LYQFAHGAIVCLMLSLFNAIGLIALLITGIPTGVLAARAKDKPPEDSLKTLVLPASNVTVKRVQSALKDAGYYEGSVDGRFNEETERAILEYQSHEGLPRNPVASKKLANHIQTSTKVQSLLKQLQAQRLSTMEEARQALLTQPETRDLVLGRTEDNAQATSKSNPALCFLGPTAKCLLDEAFASAIKIFKKELRDWVLSEILVTQAKAGLVADATETIRQIDDPKLIMVALRNIAKARASAGRSLEAISAAAIIPDNQNRLEALAAIATIQADQDNMDGATATALMLLDGLDQIDNLLEQVSLASRAVIVLAKAGKAVRAAQELAEMKAYVNSDMPPDKRSPALRHIASALAEIGKPEQALGLLKDVPDVSEHTSVLVSAATVQANAGHARQAISTAEHIEAVRYRAIVLSRIAIAQAKSGNAAGGNETLETALLAADKIKLPFAQAYAYERICLALIKIRHFGGPDNFDLTIRTAGLISDNKLLAHTLWSLNTERQINGDHKSAAKTAKMAEQATAKIKSPYTRFWMFSEIALEHFSAHRKASARNTFKRALAITENLDSVWGRSRALARLASVLIILSNGANN